MHEIIYGPSYNYKKFISKWNIALFITFGYCKNSTSIYNNMSIKINDIYFYPFINDLNKHNLLIDDELNCLYYGLYLISEKIIKNSCYNKDTLILLTDIQYSLCFFQPEALTACVIEYFSKMFLFDIPEIKTTFDKAKNKYIYDFSNFL